MPPRPPPRLVVRAHDTPSHRRRRTWIALLWPISLVVTALLAGWLADGAPASIVPSHRRELRELKADNEALKQQVAELTRSQQVGDVALQALQRTLAEREEQISGLRADLGFYSRLVGSDGQRQGLRIQEVHVQAVPQSPAWNLTLSLTQNVRRGDEIHGHLTVTVEGLRGDKVEQLGWSQLGDEAQKDGMPFAFKYFQQLHGTMVLPADFRPTRLRIHAEPDGGASADRVVSWTDALNGTLTTTQGGNDAQP